MFAEYRVIQGGNGRPFFAFCVCRSAQFGHAGDGIQKGSGLPFILRRDEFRIERGNLTVIIGDEAIFLEAFRLFLFVMRQKTFLIKLSKGVFALEGFFFIHDLQPSVCWEQSDIG